jgi:hypothetical protein
MAPVSAAVGKSRSWWDQGTKLLGLDAAGPLPPAGPPHGLLPGKQVAGPCLAPAAQRAARPLSLADPLFVRCSSRRATLKGAEPEIRQPGLHRSRGLNLNGQSVAWSAAVSLQQPRPGERGGSGPLKCDSRFNRPAIRLTDSASLNLTRVWVIRNRIQGLYTNVIVNMTMIIVQAQCLWTL